MSIEDLRRNWDGLGRVDPWWAILAYPERHRGGWVGHEDEFYASGRSQISDLLSTARRHGSLPEEIGRALDFGCGAGRLTQALADHAGSVDGVDIAESMIELARDHNVAGDRVRYHLNTEPHLHLFEDETFDLVVSIIVLQHLPNDLAQAYIREFVRVLRPGGLVAFTMPSHADWSIEGIMRRTPNSWQNVYRRWRYGYDAVMEFHPLRRQVVEETLRTAGCRLVHVGHDGMAGPRFTSFLYLALKDHGISAAGSVD